MPGGNRLVVRSLASLSVVRSFRPFINELHKYSVLACLRGEQTWGLYPDATHLTASCVVDGNQDLVGWFVVW